MVLSSIQIRNKIQANTNLESLEKAGLARGEERGKRPDVSIETIYNSLQKQFFDFEIEYRKTMNDIEGGNIFEIKQTLADLRNVAGILFLTLDGERFVETENRTKEETKQ